MTRFALLRRVCGLSQAEAAAFLDVRVDTVKSWERARNPNGCPAGAIEQMRDLYERIDAAADHAMESIEDLARTGVRPEDRIMATMTDAEAAAKSWSCAAPYNMALGIALALSEYEFTIEPVRSAWISPTGCGD